MHPQLPSGYTLRTGFEAMDLDAIHRFLTEETYWSRGISPEIVEVSLRNSFCIGIFQEGRQVAFGRWITDYATFAYLSDVYVLPDQRGKSLSKILVEYSLGLDWMQKLRRLMLATRDAQGLYAQYGFEFPPEGKIMQRVQPQNYGDFSL